MSQIHLAIVGTYAQCPRLELLLAVPFFYKYDTVHKTPIP